MTAKQETESLAFEYDLPYAPARVWRTLTEPELLAKWIMNTDMQPQVGRSFKFTMDPTPWWDGVVQCEVLEMELHKRLSYTWKGGPANSPLDTIVTWTLTPTSSGGTRLGLVHSGFVPSNKFAFDGARQGWERNVSERLTHLLATL